MAQYQLPRDFFFGAAMSGPQTEGQWNQGGKLENLWDTWSIQDLGSFYNCVGSYAGNDFMAKYQEDFRILKDLGLNTYRTSIQWSRLLDADGNLNEEGAAWYHELFRASREAGLEPFVNLYHFDMPTYLFNRGGWESREVVEAYAHYADVAFHEFGQEIKYWFTFNEPIVEPEQRYQEGVWFPQLHDFNRARTVQYHISLAHSLAVANYRRAYDEGAVRSDAKIGMINCFTPVYTKENPNEADLEAVRMTSGINNRWWLDLITKGELPADVLDSLAEGGVKLPFRAGDQEILKQGVVDWLGCNYYHPTRVQAPASKIDQYGLPHFADEYVWPDAVMNESRGWEIYPQASTTLAWTAPRTTLILSGSFPRTASASWTNTRTVTPKEPSRTTTASTLYASTWSGWPRPSTRAPSAADTIIGPSSITGLGPMPLRTVTVLSRSTLWTATSAVLRSRRPGSNRSPRPMWLISDRANAQTTRRRAQHMAHLVAEGDRPPCA